MALCTQKNRETATQLLKKLKIFEYFKGFAFGDSTDFLKPDIRVFQHAVKDLGPAKYYYVGDSEIDLVLALKAKATFLFHKNGYSNDQAHKDGINFSFDTFFQLLEHVIQLLER